MNRKLKLAAVLATLALIVASGAYADRGNIYSSQALQALTALVNSSGNVTASKTLRVDTTSAATTGTSKQTLATFSLPASTLNANGRGLRIRAWGITAATANSKTLGIDFGATTCATITNATNNGNMAVDAYIIRTGAATQECSGTAVTSTVSASTRATPSETLTGAVTINCFATTPTASGDFTFKGWVVEAIN